MSLEYFEKALDIVEDRFGKESSKLIPVYQGMGTVRFYCFALFLLEKTFIKTLAHV